MHTVDIKAGVESVRALLQLANSKDVVFAMPWVLTSDSQCQT